MEGHPYSPSPSPSPESGDSSPDGETPISWDDTPAPSPAAAPPPSGRVKLLCSYGGRIQPRPHDNHLSYFAGETKILAVDRSISFRSIVSKLASLRGGARCSPEDICFKYQLPGEDLDALVSVTDDEDLDHMMLEHDRMHLSAGKPPPRLRLFLFPANPSQASGKKNDRMRFFDLPTPPPLSPAALVPDFLSGIDAPSGRSGAGEEEVEEIRRLRIGESGGDDAMARVCRGESCADGVGEKDLAPAVGLGDVGRIPAGYWGDRRGIAGGEQPVYLIPASHGLYTQAYYAPAGGYRGLLRRRFAGR